MVHASGLGVFGAAARRVADRRSPLALRIQSGRLSRRLRQTAGGDLDATAVVERDRNEQQERDLLNLSSRLLHDRTGFVEFADETELLLERIARNTSDQVLLKRDLHTLKGKRRTVWLVGVVGGSRYLCGPQMSLQSESQAAALMRKRTRSS